MIDALVTFIVGEPGLAERLLAAHVDDGKGRCCGCVQYDRPRVAHPCVIRNHALQARIEDRAVMRAVAEVMEGLRAPW